MQLNKEKIQEFKALCEAEFGEEFEWAEAERMAYDLVNLYEVIWRDRVDAASASTRSDQSAT